MSGQSRASRRWIVPATAFVFEYQAASVCCSRGEMVGPQVAEASESAQVYKLPAVIPQPVEAPGGKGRERTAMAIDRYRAAFADGPLRLVGQLQLTRSAEHIFTIGVPNGARDKAIAALNEQGISVTVNFRSVTHTSYYRKRYPAAAAQCPVSETWGEQTLTLPMFPGLTEAEQDHVIRVVRDEVYKLARPA